MRPGGDPDGWRRAYVEASATRRDERAVGPVGRFALSFLITFTVASTAANIILERFF